MKGLSKFFDQEAVHTDDDCSDEDRKKQRKRKAKSTLTPAQRKQMDLEEMEEERLLDLKDKHDAAIMSKFISDEIVYDSDVNSDESSNFSRIQKQKQKRFSKPLTDDEEDISQSDNNNNEDDEEEDEEDDDDRVRRQEAEEETEEYDDEQPQGRTNTEEKRRKLTTHGKKKKEKQEEERRIELAKQKEANEKAARLFNNKIIQDDEKDLDEILSLVNIPTTITSNSSIRSSTSTLSLPPRKPMTTPITSSYSSVGDSTSSLLIKEREKLEMLRKEMTQIQEENQRLKNNNKSSLSMHGRQSSNGSNGTNGHPSSTPVIYPIGSKVETREGNKYILLHLPLQPKNSRIKWHPNKGEFDYGILTPADYTIGRLLYDPNKPVDFDYDNDPSKYHTLIVDQTSLPSVMNVRRLTLSWGRLIEGANNKATPESLEALKEKIRYALQNGNEEDPNNPCGRLLIPDLLYWASLKEYNDQLINSASKIKSKESNDMNIIEDKYPLTDEGLAYVLRKKKSFITAKVKRQPEINYAITTIQTQRSKVESFLMALYEDYLNKECLNVQDFKTKIIDYKGINGMVRSIDNNGSIENMMTNVVPKLPKEHYAIFVEVFRYLPFLNDLFQYTALNKLKELSRQEQLLSSNSKSRKGKRKSKSSSSSLSSLIPSSNVISSNGITPLNLTSSRQTQLKSFANSGSGVGIGGAGGNIIKKNGESRERNAGLKEKDEITLSASEDEDGDDEMEDEDGENERKY